MCTSGVLHSRWTVVLRKFAEVSAISADFLKVIVSRFLQYQQINNTANSWRENKIKFMQQYLKVCRTHTSCTWKEIL
jgi:hypothetical protein